MTWRGSVRNEKAHRQLDKWAGKTLIAAENLKIFKREKDYSEESVIRFARDWVLHLAYGRKDAVEKNDTVQVVAISKLKEVEGT